ncbi:MAG: PDZ domain-containing protein [Deltaproteobacteria bacterium]|nr:PDZ domain-containing protein [Deltaproteobacteria bacterium]
MSRIYKIVINIIAITLISYVGIDSLYRIVIWRLNNVYIDNIAIENELETGIIKRKLSADFHAITDRNIFDTINELSEKEVQKSVEALEPSKLNITLLGTVVGNPKDRVAVIEEKENRKQALYRVGDSIQNSVIKSILRGKIVLRVGDKDEVLVMPEPSSFSSTIQNRQNQQDQQNRVTFSPSLDRTVMSRQQDFEQSLEEIDELLKEIRITPHVKDGGQDGVVITGIRAGSILRRIGLRDGDIINSVNNEYNVYDDESMLSVIDELRAGSDISLQIERRGRKRTLNYKLR